MKQMKQNLSPKIPKFVCNECQYNTDNKTEYSRHLLTAKHINRQNATQKAFFETNETQKTLFATSDLENPRQHKCICNKIYNCRTTLWRHKQKCSIIQTYNNQEPQNIQVLSDSSNEIPWTIDPSSNEIKLNETMMYKLFKEMMESTQGVITTLTESNKEVISTMTESNKEVMSTMTESNNELKQIIMNQQTQILELASKPTINNTMNNTMNNNTNITVNMFLNDY